MPLVHLVRHGRAAGGYTEDLDPGLDDMGRTQGFMVLEAMKGVEPIDIISSPMRRCVETAMPLAKRWGVEPRIVEAMTEIPSGNLSVEERGTWLNTIMQGNWSDVEAEINAWREKLFEFLAGLESDAIIFSHFIAINAIIGRAQESDQVVCALLENGSITKVQVDGEKFELVELGKVTGKTRVR